MKNQNLNTLRKELRTHVMKRIRSRSAGSGADPLVRLSAAVVATDAMLQNDDFAALAASPQSDLAARCCNVLRDAFQYGLDVIAAASAPTSKSKPPAAHGRAISRACAVDPVSDVRAFLARMSPKELKKAEAALSAFFNVEGHDAAAAGKLALAEYVRIPAGPARQKFLSENRHEIFNQNRELKRA